jgi:predicted dehydrogenase
MIGAAIVGLGWWGRTVAQALADSDLIRPVIGVDPDPARRASSGLPEAASLEAALAHPEVRAVILCTPHRLHAAQIRAAANAGRHVFCEKPLCTNLAELDVALDAVRRAGVVLAIGHERRFEPAVIEMRQRAAAGAFGALLALEGNFSQDKFLALPPDNWRLSASDAPVGPLSATGIHLVDLSIALLGEPVEVWARLATRATGFANGDTLSITMAFASGATALINAILATPFNGRLALFGALGWMAIEDRTHPENPTGWDVTTAMRGGEKLHRFYPPHHAVRDNLHAFARAIAGGAAYPVSHQEMRANVGAFAAITRSVASGAIERV